MTLDAALAVAAALVAVAFAMSTFERWLARRQRYEAAWTVAFGLFAIASFALAFGAGVGWSPPVFRIFYAFGAVANVPFLAVGEVELLFGRRVGRVVTPIVTVAVAWAIGVVAAAPLTHAIPAHRLVQGSDVFGVLPRVLAGVCSGLAALVVVGGAGWSVVRTVRRKGPIRFVVSNGLIAAGTLITGASGLFNSVLDEMGAFAVALAAGIVTIFAGFLLATTGPSPRTEASVPPATEPRPAPSAVGAEAPSPPRPTAAQARG